ncbi:MAG: 50S ribosomal protein L23 [candidate division Zixibacteria bacterium 4484_95]|nr:MAG: 50S ribosomal protein L23 [candidate division Zixibacteria bacterium 4484_95]RKX18430.1 MAG: 50S ribosomal protein L23 [candidate division Zixibacteria bacterium]
MKAANDIVYQAIISEKGSILKDKANRYLFKVHPRANKIEIGKAIESAFNVKVLDVKTMNMKGKAKKLGRFEGQRSSWKKAVVKLKEGDSIEIFENV